MTLEYAIRSVWYRLAAKAGIDVRAVLSADDLPIQGSQEELLNSDEPDEFHKLRDEADTLLLGLMIQQEVGVWRQHGEGWKRLLPRPLMMNLARKSDEPSGLYVDRHELVSTLSNWKPEVFAGLSGSALLPPSEAVQTARPVKQKPGPKTGPGYSPKDVPTFQAILAAQRESGNVHTKHALAVKFSGVGTDFQANKDRLRKTLPTWLAENGHEWKPSN